MPGLGERTDHLRHHIAEEENHDGDRHQPHHPGVDERRENLAPQVIAFLDVVRQPLHHLGQVTGLFTGGNQRPVDFRKIPWPRRQGLGQAHAAAHIGAHRAQGLGDVLALGLFHRGAQRRFQRQACAQQARQLPGGPGQVVVRKLGAEQATAVGWRRIALNLHLQCRQPTAAQQVEAAPWLSASKCPDSILPWASAASKR